MPTKAEITEGLGLAAELLIAADDLDPVLRPIVKRGIKLLSDYVAELKPLYVAAGDFMIERQIEKYTKLVAAGIEPNNATAIIVADVQVIRRGFERGAAKGATK